MGVRRRALLALFGVALFGVALTGCGSSGNEGPSAAATGFYAAIAAGDGTGACGFLTSDLSEELAEEGDCGGAVLAQQLTAAGDVESVAIYGSAAQVTLGGDVVFLNDAAGRWEVTAAGCTARPEQPYRCRIGG
jgi:hypothetical protein